MTSVVLTDTEWMQLIDSAREDSALPGCCANISALRDVIITVARNGGVLDPFLQADVERVYGWCFPDHDLPEGDNALTKFAAQLGLTPGHGHEPSDGLVSP